MELKLDHIISRLNDAILFDGRSSRRAWRGGLHPGLQEAAW